MSREQEPQQQPVRETEHGLKAIDTLSEVPPGPLSANLKGAYLVHIYPTGPDMASRYILGQSPLMLGRGLDCDIPVNDQAASRRHALIEFRSDAYHVYDLGSTNGTFVNNQRVTQAKIDDGDNLRVGNHIYRFLLGGNVEVDYHEEIYRLTIVDALTETYNKRYLMECLARELTRSMRYNRPVAFILFDVDHFKKINDTLGHVGGDLILRDLAQCVKAVVRREGIFARYGGEEFAVVLPETSLEGAICAAERIRTQVENHAFKYDDKEQSVTVSLGVTAAPGDREVNPDQLIQQADGNLYKAKRDGRNRVVADATSQVVVRSVDPNLQTMPVRG